MDPPSRSLRGESPLVTYSFDSDETVIEAIVMAFQAGNIDVFEKKLLYAQIDTDALNAFDWQSDQSLRVSCLLWGHRTVITPEAVRIYTDS